MPLLPSIHWIKCAKSPCLQEVSHTLVHFGDKEWHRNESSDAWYPPNETMSSPGLSKVRK